MTNDDIHYRLYRSPHHEQPTVICVQWFDYPGYQGERFLSEDRYDSETEALAALAARLPLDLPSFLVARFSEDEAAVRANWNRDGVTDERWWGTPFQPSRILAECAAKRRIVQEHGAPYQCETCTDGTDYEQDSEGNSHGYALMKSAPCTTLRLLALPYADHAEYRDEWKP